MESLLWHVTNRTAETLLIFNLFHLLLAGLAVMVLVHQRVSRGVPGRPERLLTIAFGAIVGHFALLTLRFAAAFYFHVPPSLAGLENFSHGLLVTGVLVLAAAYLDASKRNFFRALIAVLVMAVGTFLIDLIANHTAYSSGDGTHSWGTVLGDAIAIAALVIAVPTVIRGEVPWKGRAFRFIGLVSLTAVFALHMAPVAASSHAGILLWNLQEHLMSLSLFAFTWAVGERSEHLLDRVFVRLNLTFLILASLIMLITAGMEKYQYFRLAEQRSVTLAEFLRGHYLFYRERGETMEQLFDHPEVLRQVVTEFGSLPELREVNIYGGGQHVAFRYMPNFEVKKTITRDDANPNLAADSLRNSFQMIRLPMHEGAKRDRVEMIGTLDYVNAYIGKYIIFIYCSFTLMLALGTVIIGMIVADTDRQLKRRYSELQQTQQQLAQAAKLASIGELAGGMAHEINNPITSILALASHMAERENGAGISPRGRKNLQIIVKQAERVGNLVGGLLSFSRQSQLHISDVHLAQLLDTALDLVHFRVEASGIRVVREIPQSLPAVQGDGSRLTEVFVNLLSNALDAVPRGGMITVRANYREQDGGVRIEVQDTGSGIAAEDLPRIFDPFFTTKAPGRGTGLGLSISHGIIKDHGGEIWAQSEQGVGTTIVVALNVGVKHESACASD